MSNNIIKPKFLSNIPIGDDLFEGKSQEKIGTVIAEILTNENFQIIGIDGAWGTGKSNLVKIIEKKLLSFHFFMYDVWGHQEDDQRKAILVELTEYISEEKANIVSDKLKWRTKLKILLSKEKEVTTINRPYLSVGFIFSLFSIIYVPTVNVFKDTLVDFLEVKQIFYKLLLVTLPIFIVLGIYIFNLICLWVKKEGFWNSFKLASQKTFQVYTNKQEEETKIETISENEPSVKDFRNWMKEIDNDLGTKKLILVFDNFDRLPKRHILSIWSSIHIFFAEEKYKNIKVIIPFDRLHIKNAFKDLNGSNDESDYANDYINKTFDLVYRVSQPILSDWKVFFKSRWKDAFTNIDEVEFIKVLQIYEIYRQSITPREIIACINEIVSIKLLDQTIPDRYITLFVLHKDNIIKNPLSAITSGEFLAGLSYLYKEDEDFQKYITALAYQINPENALEVAYRKQLKDSLINKNLNVFVEISRTNVFSKIIESVIHELENFENPIEVLDGLDSESKISKEEVDNIWHNIYLKAINITHDEFNILDYQKIILKHIEIEKSQKWIDSIIKKLKDTTDFDSVRFSKLMDELDSYLISYNIEINLFERLSFTDTKKIKPESFIKLVSDKKENYKKYNITTIEDELNEYLINQSIVNLENIEYLIYLKENFNLEDFVEDLMEKIESNKADSNILNTVYKTLKSISSKKLPILSEIEIYNLFPHMNNELDFYYDLLAMRLTKLDVFNSTYNQSFTNLLNSDDSDLVSKVAQRIQFFMDYDKLLIGVVTFPTILYKSILHKIINDDYGIPEGSLNDILIVFEDICVNLEVEEEVLFYELNKFNQESLTSDMIPDLPLCLFEKLKDSKTELALLILNLANDYFTSLDKAQWVSIYNNFEKDKFQILKIIGFKKWNSYSTDALNDVLIDLISNKKFNNSENYNYLFNSLQEANINLNSLFKNVRDKLYSDAKLINKELFLLLISPFSKSSILNDKAGDSFRTFFKTEFLDDDETISAMITYSENLKELLKISSTDDTSSFTLAIFDRKNNEKIKILISKLNLKEK